MNTLNKEYSVLHKDIIASIIDNKNDKIYLSKRYARILKHIEFFIEHENGLSPENKNQLNIYVQESKLIKETYLS